MTDDDIQAELRALVARIRASGVTQMELSERLGASQSQISRILNGHTQRRTRLFNRLCEYAYSDQNTSRRFDPRQYAELIEAIETVWDGSTAHGHALAVIIRSLELLQTTEPAGPTATRGQER